MAGIFTGTRWSSLHFVLSTEMGAGMELIVMAATQKRGRQTTKATARIEQIVQRSKSKPSDMKRFEKLKSAQTFDRFGAARPSQFRSQQADRGSGIGANTVADRKRNPGVGFVIGPVWHDSNSTQSSSTPKIQLELTLSGVGAV
jgi:hypothetical protein